MTVYRWKAADPAFAEQWDDARDRKVELVEAVLFRQAMSGDLGAICFFLKANRPEIYNRRRVIDPDALPNDGARHEDNPRVVIYLPDNRRHLPDEPPTVEGAGDAA